MHTAAGESPDHDRSLTTDETWKFWEVVRGICKVNFERAALTKEDRRRCRGREASPLDCREYIIMDRSQWLEVMRNVPLDRAAEARFRRFRWGTSSTLLEPYGAVGAASAHRMRHLGRCESAVGSSPREFWTASCVSKLSSRPTLSTHALHRKKASILADQLAVGVILVVPTTMRILPQYYDVLHTAHYLVLIQDMRLGTVS